MIAAPAAMKTARRTRAISTPTSSTRCWRWEGTENFAMIRTKTKRLSTLSDFSVMKPAKNSCEAWPWPKNSRPRPNSPARTIQTTVQMPASLIDTSCGLRPMKKSAPMRMPRPRTVSIQRFNETSTFHASGRWLGTQVSVIAAGGLFRPGGLEAGGRRPGTAVVRTDGHAVAGKQEYSPPRGPGYPQKREKVKGSPRDGHGPAWRRALAARSSACSSTRPPGGGRSGSNVQACPTHGSARWSSGTGESRISERHSGSSSGP